MMFESSTRRSLPGRKKVGGNPANNIIPDTSNTNIMIILADCVQYRVQYVLHDTSIYSDGTVQGTVPGTQDEWANGERNKKTT